jgi:uncharacterized protein (TIGR02421 family)
VRTAERARYAAVRDAAARAIELGLGGAWDLPSHGLLHIERPLPFLAIGRLSTDPAVAKLCGGLASRLLVPGDPSHAPGVEALARSIGTALLARTKTLLVIWIGTGESDTIEVHIPPARRWDAIVAPIERAFSRVSYDGRTIGVEIVRAAPSRARIAWPDGVCEIDLSVPPIFRSPIDQRLFPMWLEELRKSVISALLETAAVFAAHTGSDARLGASFPDAAAREADRVLCKAADAFEVLVQLTPANLEGMWARLVETRFEEEPVFKYRPLPFDPVVLKREVLGAPVEEIEDPFVAELMREKQEELDRLLSMLRDRGDRFLHDSEVLFGSPDPSLLDVCARILAAPSRSTRDPDTLPLHAIIARTRAHMRSYRDQDPLFPDELELRDDIAASLMVSRGTLFVRPDLAIGSRRLDALLEHEVGTHVVTWFNGSAQPLRIFGVGLAGYEALQEGLAVLAEHLAGALDPARMRVLAARVVAADAVASGASFLMVFRRLRALGISEGASFQTTVRALRGGGMTKDLAYMRGLLDLIGHLREGHPIEPLYAGKFALAHTEAFAALAERGVVAPPRVLPAVLGHRDARARLDRLLRCASPAAAVLELAEAA